MLRDLANQELTYRDAILGASHAAAFSTAPVRERCWQKREHDATTQCALEINSYRARQ